MGPFWSGQSLCLSKKEGRFLKGFKMMVPWTTMAMSKERSECIWWIFGNKCRSTQWLICGELGRTTFYQTLYVPHTVLSALQIESHLRHILVVNVLAPVYNGKTEAWVSKWQSWELGPGSWGPSPSSWPLCSSALHVQLAPQIKGDFSQRDGNSSREPAAGVGRETGGLYLVMLNLSSTTLWKPNSWDSRLHLPLPQVFA